MQTSSDLRKRALWLLEQMPVEVLQRVVSLLEIFWKELGTKSADPSESIERSYDFSDLAGRLQWQGDAVEAQRSLRDEW